MSLLNPGRRVECEHCVTPTACRARGECVIPTRGYRYEGLGHPEQPPDLVRDWSCDPDEADDG